MTQDEYNAIEQILYDKDRNFLVRSRLIEYMETVKIEEKSVEAPSIEEGVEDPQEWQIPKELFLSGKPKPEYPCIRDHLRLMLVYHAQMKTLTLKTKPIPVNQRNTIIRGKIFLSKIYRETKEAIQWEIKSQYKGEPQEGEVTLNIMFYYGDKRKRDIDAYLKILLDAMSGIVYADDSQINEMHLFKEVDVENPRTIIQIL